MSDRKVKRVSTGRPARDRCDGFRVIRPRPRQDKDASERLVSRNPPCIKDGKIDATSGGGLPTAAVTASARAPREDKRSITSSGRREDKKYGNLYTQRDPGEDLPCRKGHSISVVRTVCPTPRWRTRSPRPVRPSSRNAMTRRRSWLAKAIALETSLETSPIPAPGA